MLEPKISIIIPVYNTEKYLEQCLNSILAQTYKNLEIICIDDGSTDNSPKILEHYAKTDERIKIITQKNQGQSIARNNGIDVATGDWLTFADSDDWVGVECYQRFIEVLNGINLLPERAREQEMEVYMFNGVSFTKNDNTPNDLKLREFFSSEKWGGKNNEICTYDDCNNPFEGNLAIYNKIYKTDFLRKNNLKFKEGYVFQDSLFWIEALISALGVYVTDEVFYYYRQQSKSVQHSISEKVFNLITITNMIKDKLKEHNLFEESKYALLQYKFRQYAWFYMAVTKEYREKFYDSARADLSEEIKDGYKPAIVRQLKDSTLLADFLNLSAGEFFEKYIWTVDKTHPQQHLDYFCIHLVGECNLRCKGCDHFAPLAEGEYLSVADFEKDFKRLSELTNGNVNRIGLMGGEPLLHPELIRFFPIARKYFPNSDIQVVTNGILLSSQKEEFWQGVKENNITVMITKYPINVNHDKIRELAGKYRVRLSYYNNPSEEKTSYKIPLDVNGNQDEITNFKNCFHSNKLCFLGNGLIYPCTVAPNVYRFNKAFGYNLPTGGGVNIYEVTNEKELLEKLAKPLKMCKYCDVKNREYNLKWERSGKNISEWVLAEK